jgi:hypothetical protein
MWNWFNCYLSGRHDYGKWCEGGAIFLRCIHCGRRSSGWAVHAHHLTTVGTVTPKAPIATTVTAAAHSAQVLPFNRQTTAR